MVKERGHVFSCRVYPPSFYSLQVGHVTCGTTCHSLRVADGWKWNPVAPRLGRSRVFYIPHLSLLHCTEPSKAIVLSPPQNLCCLLFNTYVFFLLLPPILVSSIELLSRSEAASRLFFWMRFSSFLRARLVLFSWTLIPSA